MYCEDVNECFQEINAYCGGNRGGYPLIINVENFNDFHSICQRLEADTNTQCIFVSQYTQKNGLPRTDEVRNKAAGEGRYAVIGISQALMLRSEEALDRELDDLLGMTIHGYAIVLLNHCKKYLEHYMQRDQRLKRRVILVRGEKSPLPQLCLTDNESVCVGFSPLKGIKGLLSYMEHMSDAQLQKHRTLTVLTGFKVSLFKQSLYAVGESAGIYEAVCQKYPELAMLKKEDGTQEQWEWLFGVMKDSRTFSEYICAEFGSTANLVMKLPEIITEGNKNRYWLLWLALKVFGTTGNHYLSFVLENCKTYSDFEPGIYHMLLKVKQENALFEEYYAERKNVIERLPENLPLINEYCDFIGKYERNAVYYLTSLSEREEYELVKCFSIYDYEEEEMRFVLRRGFPELNRYMQPFSFNIMNTKLPEQAGQFRNELTSYFKEYKLQKLTNRIHTGFLEKVNTFAVTRPFMKLQPRSSIVAKMKKENAGVFFFDALGVEYVSYIQALCEKYGLICEIAIGRSELPSITAVNKEFEITCANVKKISDLDEVKHHSLIYDYTACPYPNHIFRELEIIDTEIRRICAQLAQGNMEEAIILSDHGASRLAVLYGKENKSSIELEEKGIHSGRCCKVQENPYLEQAVYEDGYAILANYERFKGGRAANLEVHGGAALEEVVIPVIKITRKPENITYCFVDSVIKYKLGQAAKITLFCNVPMKQPRMQVNGNFYEGQFVGDTKHAEFVMPDLKRTGTYEAQIYDGERNVGGTYSFCIERNTKQKNLFGI